MPFGGREEKDFIRIPSSRLMVGGHLNLLRIPSHLYRGAEKIEHLCLHYPNDSWKFGTASPILCTLERGKICKAQDHEKKKKKTPSILIGLVFALRGTGRKWFNPCACGFRVGSVSSTPSSMLTEAGTAEGPWKEKKSSYMAESDSK